MQDLSAIFSSIGIDRNYSTMDFTGISEDIQGWGSEHPIFARLLQQVAPTIVVEVGTWKGASVIHMAKIAALTLGLPTKFICVDTWLGSNDVLWINPHRRQSLLLQNGYPSMFRQFCFNIIASGMSDIIYPLPMTSTAAFHTLKRLEVCPELIYIDAGHEEEEVATDVRLYYDLLMPGGHLFGDDYCSGWMGVVKAVNRFCADQSLVLEAFEAKWHVMKPG
jgi:cephalosporin hydroxylase